MGEFNTSLPSWWIIGNPVSHQTSANAIQGSMAGRNKMRLCRTWHSRSLTEIASQCALNLLIRRPQKPKIEFPPGKERTIKERDALSILKELWCFLNDAFVTVDSAASSAWWMDSISAACGKIDIRSQITSWYWSQRLHLVPNSHWRWGFRCRSRLYRCRHLITDHRPLFLYNWM